MAFIPFGQILLLCLQAPAHPGAVVEDRAGFGYDLRLRAGEELLAYRWDGGATVPFLAAGTNLRIEFGERGLRPGTRLYLPAHSLFEGAVTGASEAASRDLALAGGRFGSGIEFRPSSFLRFRLPPQDPGLHGWTVSFWIRPEPLAFGRTLCVLPGAVEIALQADGRARAALLPSGERLTHAQRLAAREWAFIVVSYDASVTRKFQLGVGAASIGATTVGVRLAEPVPPRLAFDLLAGDLAGNGQGFSGILDELAVDATPTSTARTQRAFTRAPAPGNHVLELVTAAGLRSVAPAAGATTKLVLDDAAELALGMLAGVVVADGSLRWAPGRWRELEPETGVPPARTTHPLVPLGDRRMLTFGGETRDTHLGPMANSADTWIFDAATERWEQVLGASAPAPRCHVPVAYSPDHDLVLLVGGWRNEIVPSELFDDTWVFHVGARRWERRFPGGNAIGRRSDHGLIYLPSLRRFLLMHGRQNRLYDPVANTWELMPVARALDESGQVVSYALGGSPTCGLDPATGQVLVFGGSYGPTQTDFPDTTALYDVMANTYTVLDPPARPSGRVRPGFAYDPEHEVFVLFGGVRDQFSLRHDDLWIFDPRRRTWSEIQCSNRPSPRGGYYGMAYDEGADRFVLYGGRHSPVLWLDETWTLELDWTRPGTALYTFDRVQARHREAWFADVTTPGDSDVRFLFRSSGSGAEWSTWSPSTAPSAGRRYLQVAAFLVPGSHGEVPSIRSMGLR